MVSYLDFMVTICSIYYYNPHFTHGDTQDDDIKQKGREGTEMRSPVFLVPNCQFWFLSLATSSSLIFNDINLLTFRTNHPSGYVTDTPLKPWLRVITVSYHSACPSHGMIPHQPALSSACLADGTHDPNHSDILNGGICFWLLFSPHTVHQ